MDISMKECFKIGDLSVRVPVVQGGMGVGVSLSSLAGHVAAAGGVGVLSAAQIGYRDPDYEKHPLECNLRAIKTEIDKARELAQGGIIGINIMFATFAYEEYVKAAVAAGVDIIISGAGLPMDLPALTEGSSTKLAPIVSSVKALALITRYWKKKYNRYPDMIVVEGPEAGGHLGFHKEEIERFQTESYDNSIAEMIAFTRSLSEEAGVKIPLVVGGGVFCREDWDRLRALGADGVQLGTRFVTTVECDASDAYKQAYLNAEKEDIVIVKSPVGLPGRAIHNAFLERVEQGERFLGTCKRCIKNCDRTKIPYCIADALIHAVEGKVDEGLVFCGSNAWRTNRIETVKEIMEEFV